jgi:hypothetical protein
MRGFFRRFFIPHHANNHRAKALHPEFLLCYILLFAILNLSIKFIHATYPDVLGFATDIRIEQLLNLTNSERNKVGLEPLKLNSALSRAAAIKANDMFSYDYWAHTSPSGKTPWEFITASGYQYRLAGENLAKNFSTSEGVMSGWMASPTHKDNIVKQGYHDIGFAIVNGILNGEETTLVVQMFGATDQPVARVPENELSFAQPAVSENAVTLSVPEKSAEQAFLYKQTAQVLQAIDSVVITPVVNIPSVTRDAVFLFIGLLIGIFILDELVVAKKKVSRVTGHTLAHVAFLVALAIALMAIRKGMVAV